MKTLPLNNKLWSRREIAQFFGVSFRTADCKIIAHPDFPPAVTIPHTHKRWLPQDVEEFAKKQRSN